METNLERSASEAITLVEDGSVLGLGGFNFQHKPMALVHEVIRQRKKNLTLVLGAPSSIDADLLIAAGCVRTVVVQSLSLERFGPVAPSFRRLAQAGEIRVVDADQGMIVAGLRASKAGVPSQLTRAGTGSDMVRLNPDFFQETQDPFTGEPVIAVRRLRPDVSLIHATRSDRRGTAIQEGGFIGDRLLAAASAKVIVSVEQVVPPEVTRMTPRQIVTWPHNTAAVVLLCWGAHPTACQGRYGYDANHIREYAALARTAEGASRYVEEFVTNTKEHGEYLDRAARDIMLSPYGTRSLS